MKFMESDLLYNIAPKYVSHVQVLAPFWEKKTLQIFRNVGHDQFIKRLCTVCQQKKSKTFLSKKNPTASFKIGGFLGKKSKSQQVASTFFEISSEAKCSDPPFFNKTKNYKIKTIEKKKLALSFKFGGILGKQIEISIGRLTPREKRSAWIRSRTGQ